ncbi:MAG: hypothetical protein KGL97_04565 [Alphaproteobacteria bacterium]|nr:hypothetical protein [Alphaproteobacteria bacterium]
MKRLIAATIALTFFASTAAMADGWHGRNHDGYDGRHYRHEDNTGAVVAAGIGLAALAIIASQNSDEHSGYYVQGQYGDGYGYGNRGYYQQNYGDRGYYDNRYNDRPVYNNDDDDE